MNRIERHDFTNALGLAAVLLICMFLMLRWADSLVSSWSAGWWDAEAAQSIPDPTPAQLKAAEDIRGQHIRNEVTVVVGNGTSVSGLASKATTRLTDSGYGTISPRNVDGGSAPTSTVYYNLGYRADADAIAILLSIDPAQVMVVADEIGISTEGADVIVVLGSDIGD